MADVLTRILLLHNSSDCSNVSRREDDTLLDQSTSSNRRSQRNKRSGKRSSTPGSCETEAAPLPGASSSECALPETDSLQKSDAMQQAPSAGDTDMQEVSIPRVEARFTADSTITLIYGPPKRGKSYLLKQMFNNPPTLEGQKPAVQSVVVFTPSRDDWADVPKACLRD